VDPRSTERHDRYEQEFYRMRQRKGVTLPRAHELMILRNYFGAMMVHLGEADGMVAGLTTSYADTLRPALQTIGARDDVRRVAGMTLVAMRDQVYFFADASVNIDPTAEELADIAILCANEVRRFEVEPRIAMLSFSNFGSARSPESEKMRRAVELVRERAPGLMIDGEMQASSALTPEMLEENFPFAELKGGANVLIFPCLNSGNIGYKLAQRFSGAESIGPILLGMNKPVHIMQYGGYNEADVVNMTALAVVDAQGAMAELLRR
jgi:malate dehydrogenase (oxaloacetate-decarboxylating)(NADP+)